MISLSVGFTSDSHHRQLASDQLAWWSEAERLVIHGFRAGRAPSGLAGACPRPRGSAVHLCDAPCHGWMGKASRFRIAIY
jgi:hypothetical protein